MKDSGIEWVGQIPSNWEMRRLQFSLKEIKANNNPIQTTQVLSLMKDVGVIPYDEKGDIGNKSKDNISEYHLAYPNTIVLNCMNILIGSVGISNYFGCVSPVYYVFKETEDSDLRFINYIFNTREFQKELRKYANGILEIRLRVSADDIFKRKVPLPSKEIQTQISDFLDTKCAEIDALRADIEKEIETLEAYKKSVITEVVTKGLDSSVEMKDSGNRWYGKIPCHWEIGKTLYYLSMPITDGPHTTPELYDEGVPFVSAEAVSSGNGSIDFEHIRGYISEQFYKLCCLKYIPKRNDVYMIKSGATTGRVSIVDTDVRFTIWSPLAVFRANENLIIPKFLFYAIQSAPYFKQVQDGWTYGTQQNIGMRTLETLKICVPGIGEQKEIVKFLDFKCSEIDEMISSKEKQIETLDTYKKSVIYEYVTGKKEVPVA